MELYEHPRIFNNMRKLLKKHELQASVSHTSQVFLENFKCLYNSAMHEKRGFLFPLQNVL